MDRLQKYMAACGVASRRKCDEMIAAGRVRVNGEVVTEMGTQIQPGRDKVTLDGVPVRPPKSGHVYYMLHKPVGYLVTASDEKGRRTIYELITAIRERVVPVGRLDMNSEGLLLLTNDGELAHRLMHPSFEIEKEYEAVVEGRVDEAAVRRLMDGVDLDGKPATARRVEIVETRIASTRLQMVIAEGRYRQVRRMLDAIGHPVKKLTRIREGGLKLGNLKSGTIRPLRPAEVFELRKEVGLKTGSPPRQSHQVVARRTPSGPPRRAGSAPPRTRRGR